MSKERYYYIDLDEIGENYLRIGQFLGKGHNGIVYSLPDDKIIKIFRDTKICEREYYILDRVKDSIYFPRVYEYGENYIVRDLVKGERLDKYIKENGINRIIAINIMNIIKEFKRLEFSKIDIRCKDLFIKDDFSLMIIDPKNNYKEKVNYPRHLMKGLNKLQVLDEFLFWVKLEYNEVYDEWRYRINKYLHEGIK